MTVLVLGIDGLDAEYVRETSLLRNLNPQELYQDFSGANALYTYRVWPCIMAGEIGGASSEEYTAYEPDGAYLWEKYPSEVLLAPVQSPSVSVGSDSFPTEYIESFSPEGRLERTLTTLDEGVRDAFKRDVPLVVACTRTPDIVGHHVADEADYWISRLCGMIERWTRHADEFLLVSDHGFDYTNWGGKGIDAHTRRATFASSFCDYDSMTEFCENWHEDLADVLTDQQLSALGYT